MSLLKETIRQILCEASIDKLRNMGIPDAVAQFLHNIVPCKEQSFWFAQQIKTALHQWDDHIEEYKKTAKKKKKLENELSKIADHPPIPEERPFQQEIAKLQTQQQQALTNLRRVITDVEPTIKLICQWATETNTNLGKKKTIEVTTGETDDRGRPIKKKIPFNLATAEKVAADHFGIQAGETFMTFENGWFWLDREVNFCSIEAQLMGHCGRTDSPRSSLWSLRDDQGMPHLTAEIQTEKSGRTVYQLKGKQNATPDEKYWTYIFQLLTHPNFNLSTYMATGKHGGDLEWDHIPEEQQKKIEEANPNFEIKTSEETQEQIWENAYETLTDGIEEAEREVTYENDMNVSVDVGEGEWNDDEDNVYFSLVARVNIQPDVLDLDDDLLSKGWENDLLEHLDSKGFSFPDEPRIEYGRYGLSISFLDYEDLYDEYSYKQTREHWKSEIDDKWNEFTNVIDSFFVAVGAVEPNETKDYGILSTILAVNLENFKSNLKDDTFSLDIQIEEQIGDTPISEITKEQRQEFRQRLIQLVPFEQYYIDRSYSLTGKRGKNKVSVNFSFDFDLFEKDEDDIGNLKFTKWIDKNINKIRKLIVEVLSPHHKNPYDFDVFPKDVLHLREALKHHNINIEHWGLASLYSGQQVLVTTWNHPNHSRVLALLGIKDTNFSFPNNSDSNFNWNSSTPANQKTIGEWIQILEELIQEVEGRERKLAQKLGVSVGGYVFKSAVNAAWEKLAEPIAEPIAEDMLRIFVASSLER